jgi:hypothetical protein
LLSFAIFYAEGELKQLNTGKMVLNEAGLMYNSAFKPISRHPEVVARSLLSRVVRRIKR